VTGIHIFNLAAVLFGFACRRQLAGGVSLWQRFFSRGFCRRTETGNGLKKKTATKEKNA